MEDVEGLVAEGLFGPVGAVFQGAGSRGGGFRGAAAKREDEEKKNE